MCEIGSDFILCRCVKEEFDKSKPYWQLFSIITKIITPPNVTLSVDSELTKDKPYCLADHFTESDDEIMEDGDIIIPAIMASPSYQSICDALNSRQCFDSPIEHKNMDTLVINLKGDEYRYYFSNGLWQPISLNINEPQQVLKHSGKAKGAEHVPPFKEDDIFSDWG